MKIENKAYTYDTMPDYSDVVEGAIEIATGDELFTFYTPWVVYDTKDGIDLHLQIIQPRDIHSTILKKPCVVYVQGSGWLEQNTYANVVNVGNLAKRGYVVAIVEYRHIGIAPFPAQIIDTKNAIRFLIENRDKYCIDEENIIIAGDSSGGHTAVLTGLTANTTLFDKPMNNNPLNIKGIINIYGAVDLTKAEGFPSNTNFGTENSSMGKLLGCNVIEHPEKAVEASAATYLDKDFAPMLIVHGTKDFTVSCQQSVDLYNQLKKLGKDASIYLIRGAEHTGPAFWTEKMMDIYDSFIKKCIK